MRRPAQAISSTTSLNQAGLSSCIVARQSGLSAPEIAAMSLFVFAGASQFVMVQLLKDGRAMRIETVINAPGDLGCLRRLPHLEELQAKLLAQTGLSGGKGVRR